MSPANSQSSFRRRLFARLLLLLGGLIIGLFLVEVVLRVSGFSHFNPYIADQDLGFSLRPNAEGWWRKEGTTYVRINSQGLRDREHPLSKPANTFRIAVVGDSFAEAFQVPIESTFWSVMERKLQGCSPPGARIEVINFGVSGFSTARELLMLRQRVWQYSPDLVLLLFTTRNDVRDNSRKLSPYESAPLPYFVLRGDSLVLEDSLLQARNRSVTFRLQQSFVGRSWEWLREHLRVVGLVDSAREIYQGRANANSTTEPGLDSEVFRAPTPNSDWDEAWKVTEKLILQMRDEVRAKGAKFLVVTGSTGAQTNPDSSARTAYMNQLGVTTLFYPDTRIKALGEREGFDVLVLVPLLLDYANHTHAYLHGSGEARGTGHWNETGHRIVGEIIAERLCVGR